MARTLLATVSAALLAGLTGTAAFAGQAVDKGIVQAEARGQRRAGPHTAHLRTDGQHAAIAVSQCDHTFIAPVRQDEIGREPGHEGADRAV